MGADQEDLLTWARQAADGDTAALDRLLATLQPRVMRICARMLGN